MSTLYVIAALVGGRVANTCNWSEDYVGYSTKYGDAAGDFSILGHYAVREVITMGCILAKEFNMPVELIAKKPSDGMCGKTDEDNLGFTYDTLDSLLLDGVVPEYDIYKNICERHKRNEHKTAAIRLPAPRPCVYRHSHDWEREGFEF
jgi:NAD+ synthase